MNPRKTEGGRYDFLRNGCCSCGCWVSDCNRYGFRVPQPERPSTTLQTAEGQFA
jgi:hypothetical protein